MSGYDEPPLPSSSPSASGSASEIVYKDLPVDDPKVRQPDITKAKGLLGWQPEVALEAGLGEAIDYFRTKLKAVG